MLKRRVWKRWRKLRKKLKRRCRKNTKPVSFLNTPGHVAGGYFFENEIHVCQRETEPPNRNTPHRNLLFAIIERALVDISDKDPRIRKGARIWILSDDIAPYTFLWMTDILGLTGSVKTIRKQVLDEKIFKKT